MQAAEYDAQISAQTDIVSRSRQEIGRLTDLLEELGGLTQRVEGLTELVKEAAGSMSRKLDGALRAGIAAVPLNQNAFLDVGETITGEGYQNALSGLGSSQCVIGTKQQETQRRIAELEEQIRQAQNQIAVLGQQKEAFLAEQARAAAENPA